MAKIIALSNQKGGVAKTATTIHLAGALAELGKRVLVVDIDPQGNAGLGLGMAVFKLQETMFDVVMQRMEITNIIQKVQDNIDIAPANLELSRAETLLTSEYRREDRLKNALQSVLDQYDIILIDCPPSLGVLNVNALSAANFVLIPVACEIYALMGVRLILETISAIQASVNPELQVLGIVATRHDARTINSREMLEEIQTKLASRYRVFKTVIKETAGLKEAPVAQLPITLYSHKHPSAEEYRRLTKEVLEVL